MKLVVDSSVLLKWFIAETDSPQAQMVLSRLLAGECSLHLPSLALYEVQHGLIKNVEPDEAAQAMAGFWALLDHEAVTLHEISRELFAATHTIATYDTGGQGHVSSYDALFHALALDLGATLITADIAHIRKTKAAFGAVLSLADYTA